MAIPSFFKQNKPRGFNYTPRYYDPKREELEERLRAIGREQGAWSMEHGAEGKEQGAESMEHGASGVGQEAQGREQGAWEGRTLRNDPVGHFSEEPACREEKAQSTGQPYRSKILRGDMKNYFPRNKERVERHTLIRLLVIIMIMVLAIYIYLRFF